MSDDRQGERTDEKRKMPTSSVQLAQEIAPMVSETKEARRRRQLSYGVCFLVLAVAVVIATIMVITIYIVGPDGLSEAIKSH